MLSDGRHVTSLDAGSNSLVELIDGSLRTSGLTPHNIAYVNAHGTGTQQNDVMESRGIRRALGRAADSVCVSANKSTLGHLVNASGSVELALTALALRDGFAPPTMNLTHPDPDCDLDCVPLVGPSATLRTRDQALDRLRRPPCRDRAPPLGRRRSPRRPARADDHDLASSAA